MKVISMEILANLVHQLAKLVLDNQLNVCLVILTSDLTLELINVIQWVATVVARLVLNLVTVILVLHALMASI